MPIAPDAPGQFLVGLTLVDGWVVESKIARPLGGTGGNFSVGYHVRHPDGRRGFLKAIDISAELASGDPQALVEQTEIFLFERDLLELCRGLKRVITAIAHGTVLPGTTPSPKNAPVYYLIFELAEGDARQQVNLVARLSLEHVCAALHQVAVGLQQLHSKYVAHQDIKPSNILYMKKDVVADPHTKIGDLGRAAHERLGLPQKHTRARYLGTTGYTPPELLYGDLSNDWGERRTSCDLYSLGSLIVFFFCGRPTNSFLATHLDSAHHWKSWRGFYRDVMAYVSTAFAQALPDIRAGVTLYIDPTDTGSPQRVRAIGEIMTAIEQLCSPDRTRRGHPSADKSNQFDLQRYVALFDTLRARAKLNLL